MIRTLGRGAVVAVVVAAVVLATAALLPLALQPSVDEGETNNSEFAPENVVAEPIPADGEVEADGSVAQPVANPTGVVVVDRGHANRFDDTDLRPLVTALGEIGYEVRFHGREPLEESLSDADAFVVIDPAASYSEGELDTVEEFVDEGGRLVILGEPDRVQVQRDVFGASLQTADSRVARLGLRFDIAFENRYVYDMERNDGNYKRPVVEPAEGASVSPTDDELADVDRVTVYTAAAVRPIGDGEPVLVTAESARLSGTEDREAYPVAVRDGDVLAVGDSDFLAPDTHTVADNEVFLGYLVEFLVAGERTPQRGGFGEDDGDDETAPEPGANRTAVG